MKKLSFLATCLFTPFVSQAQTDSTKPERFRKSSPSLVSVRTIDNKTINGWLYAANDSQMVLVETLKALSMPHPGSARMQIPAERIEKFTLQKRNTRLKGTLIGLGVGVTTGLIIGFSSGDYVGDYVYISAGTKAAVGATALGLTGALTGLIIGALAKKKFIIGGKKKAYRNLQGELMRRLVQK